MKGLSHGRRVHRGHRDMPPARPPVVTEAPLSPWRALWRGEDPPSPPPAAGAQRFTHILSQKHVGSRAASVPGAAEEAPGRGGGCRVTGTETSTGSPVGDAPRGRLALVAREPRVVEDRPAGFSEEDGQVRQVRLSREVRPGGFLVVFAATSSALSTPFKSVRDKSKREL